MKASTKFQVIGFLDHVEEDQYGHVVFIRDTFKDKDALIPIRVSKTSKVAFPAVKAGDLLWIHGEIYGKPFNEKWFINFSNVTVGVVFRKGAQTVAKNMETASAGATEVAAPEADIPPDTEPINPADVPF